MSSLDPLQPSDHIFNQELKAKKAKAPKVAKAKSEKVVIAKCENKMEVDEQINNSQPKVAKPKKVAKKVAKPKKVAKKETKLNEQICLPDLKSETDKQLKANLPDAPIDTCDFNLCLNDKVLYGKVVELHDGDTCKIILPVFNQFLKFDCRLTGIDTPEMNPSKDKLEDDRLTEIKNAKKARNTLLSLICNDDKYLNENLKFKNEKKEINIILQENDNLVIVKCFELDKYGRLLVELYNKNDLTKSFNQTLIDNGLAVGYDGGTKN
jgi:endonuclease YncB( thermonuclease family)